MMPLGRNSDMAQPRRRHLTVVSSKWPIHERNWSELMARAQDGDRHAYKHLLTEIEPYIRSIACKCFRQPNDVDDAVQDVLLTLHQIRHTYDPKRPFGPWFVAIANRRVVDRLRRSTRRRAREVELAAEHETFPEPETKLEYGSEAALGEAIEKLPPDQREAIRMLKLNEMSLKEAAAASGRSIAALKVATHRAVRNLRRMLRGEHE
jgi:RNA polymerase sigma-70 factor (ECF subfamily)